MPNSAELLKRFNLEWKGCLCEHLPKDHDHEVRQCLKCACDRYERRPPVEIPNFGRNQLAEFFCELGFTEGAEIGVMKGEYSEVLCKANPNLHLYCVDPWAEYKGYRLGNQETMNIYFAEAAKRLRPYNVSFVRQFSVPAAEGFADESLDFVYIDGNHDFISVTQDLNAWTPKVRKGGLICGHDYVKRGMGPKYFGKANTWFHVQEVIDAWTLGYHIDPWFLVGRKEFVEGEIRDDIRSWMWVKE